MRLGVLKECSKVIEDIPKKKIVIEDTGKLCSNIIMCHPLLPLKEVKMNIFKIGEFDQAKCVN